MTLISLKLQAAIKVAKKSNRQLTREIVKRKNKQSKEFYNLLRGKRND